MATFYRNFSADAENVYPAGFTARWNAGSGYRTVTTGGSRKLGATFSGFPRTAISLDAAGTASQQEVVAHISMSSSTAYAGVTLRGGGGDSTRTGYSAFFRPDSNRVEIWRHEQGGNTTIRTLTMTLTPSIVYGIRFRAAGTTLSLRVWDTATAEPATWDTVEDATYTDGWAGTFAVGNAGTAYYSFIGVATAGDSAPVSATSARVFAGSQRRVRVAGAWKPAALYPRVAGSWKGYAPTVLVEYQIDYIAGSTAYLYPYASLADAPRVPGKYIQVAASSITERVSVPSTGSQVDMPQLTDGNAYGYIDLILARSGSSPGNILFYHFIASSNRWEMNLSSASNAAFRLYERVDGTPNARISLANQISPSTTTQIGMRVDSTGHIAYKDGVEMGRYSTVGTNPDEATVLVPNTSGLTQSEVFLYPLRVSR